MQGETAPDRFSPDAFIRERHPGVEVREWDLPGNVLGCVDHEQRIIWISRGLSAIGRRSTLAYEIGQLQQGPTPADPCLAVAHRRAAEDWAARMLIPAEDLFAGFRLSCDLPMVAGFLQVDLPTLRARLRGLTDEEQDSCMAALAATADVA